MRSGGLSAARNASGTRPPHGRRGFVVAVVREPPRNAAAASRSLGDASARAETCGPPPGGALRNRSHESPACPATATVTGTVQGPQADWLLLLSEPNLTRNLSATRNRAARASGPGSEQRLESSESATPQAPVRLSVRTRSLSSTQTTCPRCRIHGSQLSLSPEVTVSVGLYERASV